MRLTLSAMALVLFLWIALAAPAQAAPADPSRSVACSPEEPDSLRAAMTPSVSGLDMAPGQEKSQNYTFYNCSRYTLRVRAEVLDVTFDSQGTPLWRPAEPGIDSPAHWITLDETTFEVPPERIRDVLVTARMPLNAPDGGQAAVLRFVTEAVARGSEPITGVRALPAVAGTLYLAVGAAPQRDLSVVSFGAADTISGKEMSWLERTWRRVWPTSFQHPWLSTGHNMTFMIPVVNRSSVYARVAVSFVVQDSGGRTIQSIQAGEEILRPGTSRAIVRQLSLPEEMGRYRVVMKLDYGSGVIEKTATVIVFPYLEPALWVTGTLAAAWGVDVIRRRWRRSPVLPKQTPPPLEVGDLSRVRTRRERRMAR